MYEFSQDTIITSNESQVILMSTKTKKFIVLDNLMHRKLKKNLDEIVELFSLNCSTNHEEILNFLWENQYIKQKNSNKNVIPLKYPYTIIIDSSNIHGLLGNVEALSKGYDKLINEIIIRNPNKEYFLYAKDIVGHSKYFSILFDDYSAFTKSKKATRSINSYVDRIYICLNESNWEVFLKELTYFSACPTLTIIIDFFSLTEFSIKYITNILNAQNISYSFDIYFSGKTKISPCEQIPVEKKLLSLYEHDTFQLFCGFPLTMPSRFCPQKQIVEIDNFILINSENKENCMTCQNYCHCKKCIYKNICYFRGTKALKTCKFKKILSKILED